MTNPRTHDIVKIAHILIYTKRNIMMRRKIVAALIVLLMLSFFACSAFAVSPQEYEPIGIKSYGVYPLIKDGTVRIFYAVKIENTNKNLAVMYPHIEITVSAKDGSVIKVEDQVLSWIAADDSYWYADYFTYDYDGTIPDRVSFHVWAEDDNYVSPNGYDIVRSNELVISDAARKGNGANVYYTGKITNNGQHDTMARVSVIYLKKGQDGAEKPIGGDYTFVENLKAGETKAFEIQPSSGIDSYSNAAILAIQW